MKPTRTYIEVLGLIVGTSLTLMFAFTTIAPFFIDAPQNSIRLIDQQQTILQSVFLVLVGYLWRDAEGSRVKNDTINTMAKALPAVPLSDGMTIPPGGKATVSADEAGAEIKTS